MCIRNIYRRIVFITAAYIAVTFVVFSLLILKIHASTNTSLNTPTSYSNTGIPGGMVMSADGAGLWYVDVQNQRVVELNSTTGNIIRTVGRSGSAVGEFYTAFSITRDSEGFLYVLAQENSLLYKLDPNGGFMQTYQLVNNNSEGLSIPFGITFDAYSNSFLVTDWNLGHIEKYDRSFNLVSEFGTNGHSSAPGDLFNPAGIRTDNLGNIGLISKTGV